jgi:2-phospho-L-lactate guanylyltransferase
MTSKHDIWAVLPVKNMGVAKSRLAHSCPPAFRRELARAMLVDVLGALTATAAIAGIVVVTVDAVASTLARRSGARVFAEDADIGHTGAVMAAARRLASERRAGMLTLPSDIPGVNASDLSRLVEIHGDAPAFTIVPSHDRRGSNAIVVSKPTAVPLAFGDDSFVAHLAAARRAGIEPVIESMPGIALDIDHPADLVRLMQSKAPTGTAEFLRAHANEGVATLQDKRIHR